LVQGNIMINKVYYVEGLSHNLFSVGQFWDADLEKQLHQLQSVSWLKPHQLKHGYGIEGFLILTSTTSTCFQRRMSLTKNSVVERQNRTLAEAARSMLSASKLPLFDEIKEMTQTYVANDTSGLVPQRQKASDYENSGPVPQLQNVSPSTDTIVLLQQELDLLFGPLYDEFFNAGISSVHKSSSPTDNSKQQDTPPTTNNPSSTEPTTPTTNVHVEENNNNQAEDTHVQQDEFINPFCTPTKDHPLSQVHGNPSKPVQIRRQLITDPEMCMFALTVSIAKPKTIKEAMDNSTWIEAMHEELHQFDRLQVWELIDKPFGKNIIKLKWL
ncbi:retrovirus-related pol polyprotein from transposon TNT 1-94, partial [Tanacetum coccineum]